MINSHDPGGKIRRPLPEGMGRAATFSDCGRYRYDLQRWWGEGKGTVLWIGMNPSTADVDHDDPTCQFERRYTERMGYEHYVKCNVLAQCETYPDNLTELSEIDVDNLITVFGRVGEADLIIAAWGDMRPPFREEANALEDMLGRRGRPVYCLGRTKSGAPRHPSRLGYNAEMVPF